MVICVLLYKSYTIVNISNKLNYKFNRVTPVTFSENNRDQRRTEMENQKLSKKERPCCSTNIQKTGFRPLSEVPWD